MPEIHHHHSVRPARARTRRDRQWTPADAGGQPLGRLTANLPVWIVAAVFAAFALAALVSGSEWIALGLAIAAVVVGAGALMNAGGAAGRALDDQSTTRQFAYPFAALLAGLAIVALVGVLVIVS